jgi:hypothetical protein
MQLVGNSRFPEVCLEPLAQACLVGHPEVIGEQFDVIARVVEPYPRQGGSIAGSRGSNLDAHAHATTLSANAATVVQRFLGTRTHACAPSRRGARTATANLIGLGGYT